ncbi:MAG: aminotransferase class I/II-fold pyridoxal phosphate-dependent enzyme [Muribaculaceae bacterium]
MPTINGILQTLKSENRLRTIPEEPATDMLDLSSNDYLSLGASFREFTKEFTDRFPDAAFSSSASRLLSTRQNYHLRLEDMLQRLYGRPALLFNSGYHANVGCIGALSLPSTLFVCDKLIHASVIDGLRINGAEFKRFPHNDATKLENIVEKESEKYERIVVVAESIYSMDGDEAPIDKLVELKRRFSNVILYVDEAHAFGVRGEKGLGVAEEIGLTEDIDIIVGTFGKAAASAGAFAVASPEMKSLLINLSRPFIFSTALPPANIAWTILMLEKILDMGDARKHLAEISRTFTERINKIAREESPSTSQIIPFMTGDAAKALKIASRLRESGIIALPIRRPTVPPGGERIRFSLGAGMETTQFERVFKVLEEAANEV